MEEWKTYKLGDVANVQTGPFGSQLHNKDYVEKGTPIVTVEHLGQRKFTMQNLPFVSNSDKTKLKKYIMEEGDIIFSRVGSVDRCSYVSKNEIGWLFSGRCLRIRAKKHIYPLYLYYYFCKESVKQYIRNIAVGATMPSLNTNLLSEVIIELPPLNEQTQIASILSSLDDKIEINRKINENLEQQAQALFKSWFVDFEPFREGKFIDSELGKIPEGWRVCAINDLAEKMSTGGTPKSLDLSYYNGNIKWFTTKELQDCFLFDSEKHISPDALSNSSAKVFPNGSVLMAIYASPTVGRLGILTSDSTFNQAAVGIIPKKEVGSPFIYLTLLSERNNLNNLACGAAQQNLNVGIVRHYPAILPTKRVMEKFKVFIKPIFEMIKINTAQICKLSKCRDALLPKLMNNEIKIK